MERSTEPSGRVILVDPTDHLMQQVADELVTAGFTVSTIDSASECLGHVERADVDGVVSKYELPNLDGLNLLRSVRLAHPTLPFILFPENGSEQIAGEAIAAGVSGYVPDGADPKTVVSRLEKSIRAVDSGLDDESHDRYRHLIEISPAPINLFDSDGTTIWGNNAVVELLGLDSREDLVGRSIFEFIHPDDAEMARAESEAVTEQKTPTGPTAMKLALQDGEVRYIRVATAIGEFLGTDIGQAVIVDVTEQKEREHQLEVLDTWLRHNIRNGMTLIKSLAGDIKRDPTDDTTSRARQIQEHAEALGKQADRERELLNLIISRPTPVPTDAQRVVTQAVRTCQDEYPSSSIRLRCDEDVTIRAIPRLLEAVQELISNAIEHNEADSPTVEVTIARTNDDQVEIRIADTGPGIPQFELEYLHSDNDIDQLHHGSGLGLIFASWVVRLSGGDIAFEENEPAGSIVTLTLQTDNE